MHVCYNYMSETMKSVDKESQKSIQLKENIYYITVHVTHHQEPIFLLPRTYCVDRKTEMHFDAQYTSVLMVAKHRTGMHYTHTHTHTPVLANFYMKK